MRFNYFSCPLILLLDDPADFLIDLLRSRVTDVLLGRDITAQKHFGIIISIDSGSQMITHSPPLNHVLCEPGRLFKIIRRSSGHLVHEDFLRDPTAHQHRDPCQKMLTIVAVAVFFRQLHRDTQSTTSGNDCDLMYRVGSIRERLGNDGVSRLVIGSVQTLLFRHHDRAPLGTHNDLVLGKLELLH